MSAISGPTLSHHANVKARFIVEMSHLLERAVIKDKIQLLDPFPIINFHGLPLVVLHSYVLLLLVLLLFVLGGWEGQSE